MRRIGVLSDTHSYWDDKYLEYFETCDEVWHAGDIGNTDVADRLAAFRPLRAVVGNCDGGDLRRMFPPLLRWRCEDAEVLMSFAVRASQTAYLPASYMASMSPAVSMSGTSKELNTSTVSWAKGRISSMRSAKRR